MVLLPAVMSVCAFTQAVAPVTAVPKVKALVGLVSRVYTHLQCAGVMLSGMTSRVLPAAPGRLRMPARAASRVSTPEKTDRVRALLSSYR